MSAGELNRRVHVGKRTEIVDGYGNSLSADLVNYIENEPAKISPLRGDEIVIAEKLKGRALVEIRVRHSTLTAQITEDDIVTNSATGIQFNIRYIEQPDMRGKYLNIVAERGVAVG